MRGTGYLVFAAAAYETAALVSCRRLPTITVLVHRHRHLPGIELAVMGVLGWAWWHLLKSKG